MGNAKESAMMPDCELLSDRELWELLKEQKPFAWKYVLTVVKEQEEKSLVNSRKRESWGVDLYELLGKLYEDMICNRKLWNYKGANEDTPGSLIGWMRSYLRGYLTRLNPDYRNKSMDFDGEVKGKDGEKILSVGDQYAKEMSDGTNLFAYKDEDLEVLKHERLEIAQKCFADLWRENSAQAYVMLLKTRFQMSSLEIKDRLGISSAANVDQMFSRAVKKMKELKVKYDK